MEEENKTFRPISEGGEKWIDKEIKCLDKGFVRLVDYMGNDEAVVQAARVSYGKGTKKISEDKGLIRYLLRHTHTTPFEMVEFKFHCKMPIFVARQWIRHRTANVNEYSARYSQLKDDFYLPEESALNKQDAVNKQGRAEELSADEKKKILINLTESYKTEFEKYEEFLKIGLAREVARINLPLATYTEWYWKIDLHNLMHFLKLRLDSHAQYEIRVFAEAMAKIVKDTVPLCYEAFEDYALESMNLSKLEKNFIAQHQWPVTKDVAELRLQVFFNNKREADECMAKLKELNFIKD